MTHFDRLGDDRSVIEVGLLLWLLLSIATPFLGRFPLLPCRYRLVVVVLLMLLLLMPIMLPSIDDHRQQVWSLAHTNRPKWVGEERDM